MQNYYYIDDCNLKVRKITAEDEIKEIRTRLTELEVKTTYSCSLNGFDVSIFGDSGKGGNDEVKAFISDVADYLVNGSYVQMSDTYGDTYRYVVRLGNVEYVEPEIVWGDEDFAEIARKYGYEKIQEACEPEEVPVPGKKLYTVHVGMRFTSDVLVRAEDESEAISIADSNLDDISIDAMDFSNSDYDVWEACEDSIASAKENYPKQFEEGFVVFGV